MIVRRAVLALALALIPAAASAQPSDADKNAARALAEEGQEALDKRDFSTAADRFARAGAQVGQGKWIAAQETYNRLLREGAPAGAPPVFAKALADARRELDALDPRIPGMIITVRGAASPRVTLDGAAVPGAWLGMTHPVDPGRHVVRAEAEGYAPAEATVTAVEHKTETVPFTLVLRAAASPPVAPPLETPPPAAGGSTRKTLGFTALGVGGAGLLVGAIVGGVEIGKHSQLANACPGGVCPPSQYGALDSYHGLSNVPVVGLVVGGVLAAAGVVLVVTAPKAVAPSEVSVAPVIGPGFAGVQGRF
jgi:hypothetical protein